MEQASLTFGQPQGPSGTPGPAVRLYVPGGGTANFYTISVSAIEDVSDSHDPDKAFVTLTGWKQAVLVSGSKHQVIHAMRAAKGLFNR